MKQVKCNRCGDITTGDRHPSELFYSITAAQPASPSTIGHVLTYDLCFDCFTLLDRWIERVPR